MIDPVDIHPLTEFQRNAKSFVSRLKKSGSAEVLTVNGRPALVVQDAQAYRDLINGLQRAYTIEAVRVGLQEMEAGKGRPWTEVRDELKAKYGSPVRKRRSA